MKKPNFDKLATEAQGFEADLAKKRLESQVSELKGKLNRALIQHDELSHAFAEVSQIDLSKHQAEKITCRPGVGVGSQSVGIVLCSDWHVMEAVDPDTVNGKNRFNPEVCRARVGALTAKIHLMLKIHRVATKIDDLVLALMGDFINNMIHDDAKESNHGSPTEEVEFAYGLIRAVIDSLLEDKLLKRITVPCVVGNHGRDTMKPRASTAWKRSYEWLIYSFLASHYAGEKRIHFVLSKSAHVVQEVYGRKIRFHHGDMIRYGGGVGGLTVPANKAINEWNKSEHVWMDCFGHYHRFFFGGNFVANGSLVGFNAYALQIKASAEPPQQVFFLVEKDHGLTGIHPLYLEKA